MTAMLIIKIIVVAVIALTASYVARDMFISLVNLDRRRKLKKKIRKFRSKPSVLDRDKPKHVSRIKESK